MRKDDDFTLNRRPTVPVGCEEQIGNAKCTTPFLSCEGAGTQTTCSGLQLAKQLDSWEGTVGVIVTEVVDSFFGFLHAFTDILLDDYINAYVWDREASAHNNRKHTSFQRYRASTGASIMGMV